jgi:hypothetical protein
MQAPPTYHTTFSSRHHAPSTILQQTSHCCMHQVHVSAAACLTELLLLQSANSKPCGRCIWPQQQAVNDPTGFLPLFHLAANYDKQKFVYNVSASIESCTQMATSVRWDSNVGRDPCLPVHITTQPHHPRLLKSPPTTQLTSAGSMFIATDHRCIS